MKIIVKQKSWNAWGCIRGNATEPEVSEPITKEFDIKNLQLGKEVVVDSMEVSWFEKKRVGLFKKKMVEVFATEKRFAFTLMEQTEQQVKLQVVGQHIGGYDRKKNKPIPQTIILNLGQEQTFNTLTMDAGETYTISYQK